jgi:UDP-N-acetylglucosamine:LPS N-acetylglucosamine transferase
MIPHILSNSAYFGSRFPATIVANAPRLSPSATHSLKKIEARLVSHLKENFPDDQDNALLISANLKRLRFEKTSAYSAVIHHPEGAEEGGASTGQWELKNIDPAKLSRIEADFADYADAKESESKKTGVRANAGSEASIRARLQLAGRKKPVMACIYGGQGDTHRIHQQVVREIFQEAYGDKFEIKHIDLPVTGIKRDAALQAVYDATNKSPILNEVKWQEQMKTLEKQAMARKVEKLLEEVDPDVVFSNYDTIARIAMEKLKEKYGEDRPPMVQHLSDLGIMHIRWILKEFAEKNSKDLVLTSGQALVAGESDQRQFVLDQGVPPERVIHTGAPVRADFKEVREMSKQDCRNELRTEKHGINTPDGKMSFLTMSGSGFWPEKFLVANDVLANSDISDKIHLVPIAGRLESTEKALKERIPPSVDILGYTSGRKLALLQRAVDVNIIKGGGGGIPEVTNVNRAFLVNDALPGPEPENAKFVQEQGIGLVALITKNEDGTYNTDAFMKAVRNIIEHPEILEKIEEAQKAHIVEDSAERIADILHRTGMEHYEAKMKREALAHVETSQDVQELD